MNQELVDLRYSVVQKAKIKLQSSSLNSYVTILLFVRSVEIMAGYFVLRYFLCSKHSYTQLKARFPSFQHPPYSSFSEPKS